jgi:ferredoxin
VIGAGPAPGGLAVGGPPAAAGAPATAEVRFAGGAFPPLRLPVGSRLAEHLTIQNSPVLFGCRTGICGTCLIRAAALGDARLAPPGREESELLGIVAPAVPDARLTCQLVLGGDVLIGPVDAGTWW